MGLSIYLAMTAWEYENCALPPEDPAWMACHFSSYGAGLSNIPEQFPPEGILMVNDRIPPAAHSPDLIARQLSEAVTALTPKAVILDFQRPFSAQTQAIAEKIQAALPCPVAVTQAYAQNWEGAVFLPPVPLGKKMEDFLQQWKGRQIWLEVTKGAEQLMLDAHGCNRQTPNQLPGMPVFHSPDLFCHYSTQVAEDRATFSLWRTDEDLTDMLKKAEDFGVCAAVGLYQEFC